MRHTLGNSPKCNTCYFYREKEAGEQCRGDGWCTNKKQCAVGVNGRKRENPPEREAVMWQGCCRQWEDAEDRLTHYEVLTRQPEPWRSEIEKALIISILEEEKQRR